MSDLSTLGHIISGVVDGKTSLSDGFAELEQLGAHVVAELGPGAQATIDATVTNIKNVASAALGLAATDIAPYMASAAAVVEGSVDTLMIAATKGGAAPLIPLLNASIDQIEAQLQAAISAKILAWKAKLASNSGSTVTPTVAAVSH